jgi:hypothetical protein
MARKPQVRYWQSRGSYYCQVNGVQHRLASGPDDGPSGPTFLAALEGFKQLLALGAISTARDRNTIRAVMETYMQHAEVKLQPNTLKRRLYVLTPFIDRHGDLAVGDLTPFLVDDFILSMRKPRPNPKGDVGSFAWGDGTVDIFLRALHAAFRWGIKRKLITINPVEGIDKPARRTRTQKCLVSE